MREEMVTYACVCSEVNNHVTFSHLILSVRLKLVNYIFSDDRIVDNKTFQNILPVHLEGERGEGDGREGSEGKRSREEGGGGEGGRGKEGTSG